MDINPLCEEDRLKYAFKFYEGSKFNKKELNRWHCEINKIPYNIKSHSFRINMVSRLLKNTTVQDAADIIGHKDIKSTMAYKRYALNKKEIQKLLNKIDKDNSINNG